MKQTIKVQIKKVTVGQDGLTYLTITHPLAKNFPSLLFDNPKIKEKSLSEIVEFLNKYEK